MKSYRHLAEWAMGQPWAVTPRMLGIVQGILAERLAGDIPDAETIAVRIGAADGTRRKGQRSSGSIAVLPIYGVVMQHADMMSEMSGAVSVDRVAQAFRTLMADASVGTIVLDIDSPGGGVYGVPEFAAEVFAARSQKRVVAQANSLAASAAYWIASAAEELVVTPGGEVGSIGVYALHEDWSGAYEQAGVVPTLIKYGENKAEGIDIMPLSDEARTHLQESVNMYGEMFTGDVAKQRGVSRATVNRDFGQGRVFGAEEAVSLKMADSVGSLQQTLERLIGQAGGKGSTAALLGEEEREIAAEVPRGFAARERERARLELAKR
jgi:signal peptide peptidase SppA